MDEPHHVTLDGTPTTADDPKRGIWHGVRGCTYWTDDWETVSNNRFHARQRIPCCPTCGAPGFQTTAQVWFDGVERYQSEGHPGYVAFVAQSKEQCRGRMTFADWYKEWNKKTLEASG